MRAAGLVEEVAALGGSLSRTARQAIGYKELLDALEHDGDIDEAFALVVRRTRSFARRQRMWFRRDPRITWLGAADNPCTLLAVLLALWRA
jgi:tRNA dimethylallyltransferase